MTGLIQKNGFIKPGIGILAGITLCGPAAQAATGLTATLSTQPIYVDGQQVSILGFRLGVKITMECMDENDGDIKNGG